MNSRIFTIDRVPGDCLEGPAWGNGKLGAMLYCREDALHFTLDHIGLWEMRDSGTQVPLTSFDTLLERHEDFARGDASLCERTDIRMTGIGRTRLPGLGMDVRLPFEITGFRCDTDLTKAISELTISGGKYTVRATMYLDSLQNVFVIQTDARVCELSLSGWDLSLAALAPIKHWNYPSVEISCSSGEALLVQPFSQGQYAVLLVKRIDAGDGVQLLCTLACGTDGQALAVELRAKLEQYHTSAQLPGHVKSWQAYWDRCELTLPDEALQSAVDMERYKIFCNERTDSLPVTLQGVWNLDHRMPPWFGDLHNDLNVQACYWPAFKTGCGELASAYIDCYYAAMPRFKARAKALFGLEDAIHVPVMMAPDGSGAATEWCFWNMLLGPELFVATDFCTYFDYTLDLTRLREKIYPFLQGVLALYQGIARTGADGLFHIPLTHSPELWENGALLHGEDSTFFMATLHFLLTRTQRYAALAGKPEDAERYDAFDAALAPVTHTEKGYPLFPGRDVYASHRHFCHLFPIFPLGQDGHSDTAERSLDTAVNMGFGEAAAFTFPYLAIFAARCGRGNMARTMLALYCLCCRSRNSFTVNGDPYQNGVMRVCDTNAGEPSDAFTLESGFMVPAAVCDMLAHRVGSTVWVFFGIPDAWKEASFRGIALEGGLTIDGTMTDYAAREIVLHPRADETVTLHAAHVGGSPCGTGREWSVELRASEAFTLRLDASGHLIP
jgi:hypothetical protein